ncbi:caspase family protein [Spirosoma fluviale]|uniref:Tetratricopeptide repeat-containing protein n=1 Tax=Spirosoma fluviale TaxID=1597977 RepID=A0A286GX34_9BACT|nr:caspase family protein [Spirosoma fluviale]SOD99726.1 Tetratricopeptide repeat-containing protein [Spirosoma fluviale]
MNRFLLVLILCMAGFCAMAQDKQTLLKNADEERDSLKAIQLYSKIIEQHPTESLAYYGRAIVRRQAGQLTEAINDIEQAIRLNDSSAVYYAQKAFIYLSLSEYDRAANDIRQAIKLSPGTANFYSTLSYCQTKQGRFDEAEKTAQRGIDLDPTSPFPYRNRGRARLYKGQTDLAIADFEASLQRKHREPFRVYSDLGEAYQQKKQSTEALRYYNLSLTTQPSYIEALVLKRQLERQLQTGAVLPTSTFSGRRVALVIGNSGYRNVNSLNGQPLNDARAMKDRLDKLGFVTEILTDIHYDTTQAALNRFYAKAKGADVALLFYAGHGIEHKGTNYLLPVDVNLNLERPDSVEQQAFSVTTVIDQLQNAQPRYCILILDACRDDPFKQSATVPPTPVKRDSSRVRSTTGKQAQPRLPVHSLPDDGTHRGFRPVRVESKIRNCYVALATAPGATARNGPNQNGYYTEALLKYLHQGRRLDEVLRDTRNEVIQQTQKTGNSQQPEYIDRTCEIMIL